MGSLVIPSAIAMMILFLLWRYLKESSSGQFRILAWCFGLCFVKALISISG